MKSAAHPIAAFCPSAEGGTEEGRWRRQKMGEREVYFYVGGKNASEREERKELFSREKENGREKFPFTAAPDFGAKAEDLSFHLRM